MGARVEERSVLDFNYGFNRGKPGGSLCNKITHMGRYPGLNCHAPMALEEIRPAPFPGKNWF